MVPPTIVLLTIRANGTAEGTVVFAELSPTIRMPPARLDTSSLLMMAAPGASLSLFKTTVLRTAPGFGLLPPLAASRASGRNKIPNCAESEILEFSTII